MHPVYSTVWGQTPLPDIPAAQQAPDTLSHLPHIAPKAPFSSLYDKEQHPKDSQSSTIKMTGKAPLRGSEKDKANETERSMGVLEPEELAHVYTELADPSTKTQRRVNLLNLLKKDLPVESTERVANGGNASLEVEVVDGDLVQTSLKRREDPAWLETRFIVDRPVSTLSIGQ